MRKYFFEAKGREYQSGHFNFWPKLVNDRKVDLINPLALHDCMLDKHDVHQYIVL